MNEQDKNLALLPSGFVDLLPPLAQQEADAIAVLMGEFSRFAYSRVKPPLAEFEDSLLAPGPGAVLADQTFRLMDPLSHRMMGIRPDLTVQIARIASTRMANEPRPLRLTYANDVLRTRGSQQRTERQFCQVGCEIVGPEDDEADIEICVVALIGLAALGIKSVTLDLTLPRLIVRIFDEHRIALADRAAIREALARRDVDNVRKLAGSAADVFVKLLQESGSAEKALSALASMGLSGEAKKDLEKLKAVHAGVIKAIQDLDLKDLAVTIDPVEHKGFEYECGIGFSLFSAAARGELGRGGRYNVVFGSKAKSESATGFTLYMDVVREAMKEPQSVDIVFVSSAESWETIRGLQNQGWRVMRGTALNDNLSGCTHEYKSGKIRAIKT